MEMITKSLFESMFHKAIIHIAIRNALKLLHMPLAEHLDGKQEIGGNRAEDFMHNYSDDEMAATFQVLKL